MYMLKPRLRDRNFPVSLLCFICLPYPRGHLHHDFCNIHYLTFLKQFYSLYAFLINMAFRFTFLNLT